MNLFRKIKQRLAQLNGRQVALAVLLLQFTTMNCCDENCNREDPCGYTKLDPGTYVIKYVDKDHNVQTGQVTTDGHTCVQLGEDNCRALLSVMKITPGDGGQNGKIVFQRGFDADGQIILLDPVSHSETPLGPGKNPALSPDGSLVAFERNNQIFLINPDGTNQHMLVPGQHPTWSPNGGRIAYTGQIDPQTFFGNIFRVDIQGGAAPVQLTNSSRDDTPVWSALDKIAFIRIGNHAEIFVMDANGSNQHNVTNDPGHDNLAPAWSPDGTKIVFASTRDSGQGEIYAMDAGGGNLKRLTNDFFGDEEPAYSPDGAKIVWSSGSRPGAGINKLWVMNADGSNQLILTGTPETAFDTAPDWGFAAATSLASRKPGAQHASSQQKAVQAMPKASRRYPTPQR